MEKQGLPAAPGARLEPVEPVLRIRVLGALALELDGKELELPASRRARSLLGLLAVDRRTHPRSRLAPRFWPEVLDESARTSLRSALSALRKALGRDADRYLLAGRETVALAGDDLVWTDLAEFGRLVDADRAEQALDLCRGELLEGLDDEWVYEFREEHRDRVAAALERLAAAAAERGESRAAAEFSRRRVALDPLAEDAQRALIERLAAAGDRAGALAAYKRLQDRLRTELGIAPSAQTRELVESLRAEAATEAPPPSAITDEPASAVPRPAPQERVDRPAGTVTLLFTDQVNSTEILQRLGDDEAERLRRIHFRLLRDMASAHNGQEVKNLGDGLMVAFTSAVDAVTCAIGIQQAVHRQGEREGDERLSVRVGLGVGEPIRDEDDYFGTPVVVAKRLCDAADPGQILASDVVRALVGTRGGFEFRRLGAVSLKGIAEPVATCEVAWEPTTERRIPLPPAVTLAEPTAFVGRSDAVASLEHHWSSALDGRRRVVLVAGEPGIGKTRLVAEFCGRVREEGAAVLAGRCYEEMLVPYQPFIEALRHYVAGCPPADLTVQLAPRRHELDRLVPELSDGNGVPAHGRGETDQERFRLFEAVASLLSEAARTRPTVLVLDDLQWADEASLLLLRHVVHSTEATPLMLLGTYRKTEVEAGGALAGTLAEMRRARALHEVELTGLAEREVAALISAQFGEAAPESFARRVAERTEGNPFFIEELLRHMDDPARAELGKLPETIQDLLLRRLGRLDDPCREALSVAAVAGTQFELEVLEHVLPAPGEVVVQLLEEAMGRDVVVEEPGAIGRYRFAHPLIRETIYGELSATRRALIHRRLGAALESLHAERLPEHAGALANHYHQAGELGKAFEYHLQAADAAERVFAIEAALEHLNGGVAAGQELGLAPERDVTLRDLYHRRARVRRFGYAEDSVDADYRLALDAARAAGDRTMEMRILTDLGAFWHVRDNDASIRCQEQSLAIAEELGDEPGQVSALQRLSLAHANHLDLARALELGERALDVARRTGDREAIMRAMDSLKFATLQVGDIVRLAELTAELESIARERQDMYYLPWTLQESANVPLADCRWDEARARIDEALAITRKVGDPRHQPLFLTSSCWLERHRGDYGRALELGRAALHSSQATGDRWRGWTAANLSIALIDLYAFEEAAEVLEDGLAAAERIDARAQVFRCVGPLARARWCVGDKARGLDLVARLEGMLENVRTPPGHAYLEGAASQMSAARVAAAAGELERAEAIVQRLHKPARDAGVRWAFAETCYLLAGCREAGGRTDEAEELLAEASNASGRDGLTAQRLQIHTMRARLAANEDRSEEAALHRRQAAELIEQIVASAGDTPLAERFRVAALAEVAQGAPSPS